MTEPHPRLIQTYPAAPDVAPLAQCSDCKCKRHLPGCWHRTCMRCRSSGTRQQTPPAEAMIHWDDLGEVYSQFGNNVVLPLNIHLPDDLVNMSEDYIIRRVIAHVYGVTGFEFYLDRVNNLAKRSAMLCFLCLLQ
ncbi:hypothetical protein DM01DRAFT_1336672 [Hesseltinella vesiculosa]|uniref:Uncharacterized protein n=1 Tax=Hesseltinella vesiculosa TaxID=101127 RepID=A0A1X2GEV9_9FUNG|nr:hypothetical protein DM01DRAFT_1336672 [Hesseltinella vesiculosa]